MPTRQPTRAPGGRAECFDVLDPATGEPFDEAPDHDPDTLDAVVDAAHVAWREWRSDPATRT
ncbi:aldehyde dehydrogenase, partial [Streptomyces sp. FT05W]